MMSSISRQLLRLFSKAVLDSTVSLSAASHTEEQYMSLDASKCCITSIGFVTRDYRLRFTPVAARLGCNRWDREPGRRWVHQTASVSQLPVHQTCWRMRFHPHLLDNPVGPTRSEGQHRNLRAEGWVKATSGGCSRQGSQEKTTVTCLQPPKGHCLVQGACDDLLAASCTAQQHRPLQVHPCVQILRDSCTVTPLSLQRRNPAWFSSQPHPFARFY